MSEIVEKLVKPTVEMLDHVARKIPEALGKAHFRISKMAHDAADHFDQVEEDVASKAHIHTHGGEEHLPGEGGLANSAATRAEAAAKDGGKAAEDAEREAASNAEHDMRPHDGDKESVPGSEKECETDPVDIATGDMLLPVVDVQLPGALPLILERTHISSYRHGQWFGSTWASTLDQRLQLDSKGVVFASADGMRLEYPPPSGDTEILPLKGPRLPLTWSGTPNDPMRINDPKTGRTLVFDHPRPAPGVIGGVVLRLASIEDRNGRHFDITYADDDTPALISHHGGYRVAIDRHPDLRRITGLRLLDTDGPGTETSLVRFGYNDAGDLTEVFNSSGLPLRFAYDDMHRITGWTDRNGTEYGYVYDDAGRVIRTTGSDGFMSSTFEYDDETRTTRFTNSLGHTTAHEHNDAYRLIRTTDTLGNVTVREWDESNRLVTSLIDPLGRVTRYEYDDAENLSVVCYPDGTRVQATYNELNLPVEVTDAGGASWRQYYDDHGLPARTIDPVGAETRYRYDTHGDLAEITDPLGGTTSFRYNPAGVPLEVTDALGATTRQVVDAFGRVVAVADSGGDVTRLNWSVEGKLLSRVDADGSTQSWTYDPEGNLVAHTDPLGQVTHFDYNAFDRVSARISPDGTRHEFTYDSELRLVSVTNPMGARWTYTRDAMGRTLAETDFNGRTLMYEYDAVGQLVARTNGAGQTSAYTYDLVGRLIGRTADDQVESFEFDANGRPVRAVNSDSEIVFAYDAAGRPISETCNDRALSYGYDLLGRRVTRRTPAGVETTWAYDAGHRPVTLGTSGRVLDFAYDAAGREISRRLGATTLTQAWGPSDRLLTQTLARAAAPDAQSDPSEPEAQLIQRRAYSYRDDGQLSGVDDLLHGRRAFQLDAVGRVTAVANSREAETYSYDRMGNVSHAFWSSERGAGDGSDARASLGEADYAGSLLRRAGRTTYEYDGQGRVVRKSRKLLSGGSRVWTFNWDAEDRLTHATTPDGASWRYLYDPLGRRVAKLRLEEDGAIAEETAFIWDGTVLIEQHRTQPEGSTRVTTWDWDPDDYRPLTQTERVISGHELPQDEVDQCFYAIVSDLVGTPTEIVDESGGIVWQPDASLWGASLVEPSRRDADFPLRFPGQYFDSETGLHYNFYRYYDPATARYISPDPLGLAAAPNHHAYVRNPLWWADPLGLMPSPCHEGGVDPGENTEHGHIAGVTIHNPDGSVRLRYGVWSGRTTPEEGALPYPHGPAVTHTEHRVSRLSGASTGPKISIPNDPYFNKIPVHPGESVVIRAVLPPCSRCKGAMNRMHHELGVNVTYHWDGPKGAGSWVSGRRRR